MTDKPTVTPLTEAGRALLEVMGNRYRDGHVAAAILVIEAEALDAARTDSLDVERLARATFLYRTSTNIPLPPDFWEKQSASMKAPFLAEAAAVIAALRAALDKEPKP